MYRYLGFKWNYQCAAQAAFSSRLEQSILYAPRWEIALSQPGLRVFTIDAQPGSNEVYKLPQSRGVILGKLFRRRSDASVLAGDGLLESEGDRILTSSGQALVDDYWGRYIAVLQCGHRGQGTCLLRDPSGTLPCYVRNMEGVTVFFSWLEDLLEFTPCEPIPRVNWDAIAALTSLGRLGGHLTALDGVKQVLPGKLTSLDDRNAPPLTLWSHVAFANRPIEQELTVAASHVKRETVECVQAWASCYDSILLRLSGGLDSGVLLSSLSPGSRGARITCLNYYSPGSDSDERVYARLAAGRAGVELIEKARDDTFHLDAMLDVSRTPSPIPYVGRMDSSRIDAEIASARRIPAMFTGGGGDQLFFQHRCTWPAADFFNIHGFSRGFVRSSMDAARLGRVSLWESMRRAVADQGPRAIGRDGVGQHFTLARREAYVGADSLHQFMHPDLAAAAHLPIGKFHQVRDLISPGDRYDPYMRQSAPELVAPLLSQPLIELCLSLPTWQLSHGGRSRALERQAFANDLPREIANRQSKGGMEEHVEAVLRRSLPLARRLLLEGHLVRRGMLDATRVEAALNDRVSGLGTFVGEIHHYMAIEAWLERLLASPTQ